MRIFPDANILFSAAQPHSRMRALLEVLIDRAECLTNAYAAEEARRNLATKFPAGLQPLEETCRRCKFTSRLPASLEIPLASKDQPILGGAVAGHASHLLTGDERDFGKLWGKTIQGVKIVSPRMLAQELVRLGWL